jgi:hypothetical protein
VAGGQRSRPSGLGPRPTPGRRRRPLARFDAAGGPRISVRGGFSTLRTPDPDLDQYQRATARQGTGPIACDGPLWLALARSDAGRDLDPRGTSTSTTGDRHQRPAPATAGGTVSLGGRYRQNLDPSTTSGDREAADPALDARQRRPPATAVEPRGSIPRLRQAEGSIGTSGERRRPLASSITSGDREAADPTLDHGRAPPASAREPRSNRATARQPARPSIGALLQTLVFVLGLLQRHCNFTAANVPVHWKFPGGGIIGNRVAGILQPSVLEIPRQWN